MGGGIGRRRDLIFCVCFISPSHYNLIFFEQNASAEPKVGGSEQPTKYIWIYIFPPSLSFTVGHFIFLFFSFCSFVVVFVVVVIFFLTPHPLPHISGEARRDWTRYGKQTALSGRYHSNCLTVWFAVGFFNCSILPLLFPFPIWFWLFCSSDCFWRPGQSLDFASLSFSFPLSLFFLFWSELKSKRQMETEEFGLSLP